MITRVKRRGGIASIIIALVFVVIVLAAIPMLKSLTNSNTKAANKSNTTFNSFVSETESYINSTGGDSSTLPYN